MFNQNIGGLIMRNLLLTFVLSLGSGFLFAHHNSHGATNNSDLNIKMWDNSSFTIKLDHKVAERTRSFNLKNVRPGKHYVEIIKKERNRNGNGGFVKTIYKGKINVPAQRNVFVKVEGKNRLSFKFLKKRNRNNQSGGSHVTNGHYSSSNYGSSSNNGSTNSGYYGQSNVGNNGYGSHYGPVAMNENNFNQLLRIMKDERFDNNRLEIGRQALATNHMNVRQVSLIMKQFNFDNSKLDFAKLAYNRTIDKENFFAVNSQFSFSSSASELNNYIRHKGTYANR